MRLQRPAPTSELARTPPTAILCSVIPLPLWTQELWTSESSTVWELSGHQK